MTSNYIRQFVLWVHSNLPRLSEKPAEEIAEAMVSEILRVDKRLGIEISERFESEPREVVVTAYSDRSLFGVVYQLVQQIREIPGWKFIALKPPRGFAFSISLGSQRLNAGEVSFAAIPEVDAGIQLLVSSALLNNLPSGSQCEDLAWLLVETGLGEELSSRLRHVEFTRLDDFQGDRFPLEKLMSYAESLQVTHT